MPKDEKGKNRKYKHHQEKTFTPLTKDQIQRAEKIARGEKVQEEQEEQVQNDPKEEERWKPRKLEQTRNYDIPPPEDSDG